MPLSMQFIGIHFQSHSEYGRGEVVEILIKLSGSLCISEAETGDVILKMNLMNFINLFWGIRVGKNHLINVKYLNKQKQQNIVIGVIQGNKTNFLIPSFPSS
jgi:hypothetical protein